MENPSVRPRVSVVTPAYNEAENLPLLYRELRNVLDGMPIDWEWLVVDDHSSDTTFGVLAELSQRDPRVRALRFARNSGSHLACTCGLQEASGRKQGTEASLSRSQNWRNHPYRTSQGNLFYKKCNYF